MVGKVGNALETVSGNDGQFVRHSTLYSVDMILGKRYGYDIPCQLAPSMCAGWFSIYWGSGMKRKDDYRSRELTIKTLVHLSDSIASNSSVLLQ